MSADNKQTDSYPLPRLWLALHTSSGEVDLARVPVEYSGTFTGTAEIPDDAYDYEEEI